MGSQFRAGCCSSYSATPAGVGTYHRVVLLLVYIALCAAHVSTLPCGRHHLGLDVPRTAVLAFGAAAPPLSPRPGQPTADRRQLRGLGSRGEYASLSLLSVLSDMPARQRLGCRRSRSGSSENQALENLNGVAALQHP
jgi:hypothetical protein